MKKMKKMKQMKKMKEMKAGQDALLWRHCANLQPLLEEGKRNGARRISGGILGTIPLHFSEQQ